MDKLSVMHSQVRNGITLANILHINGVLPTLDSVKRTFINGAVVVNNKVETNFNLPITLGLIADGGTVTVGKARTFKLVLDTQG